MVLMYLILINIIGFLSMYIDKKRAIKKRHRIKESTLITVALIGGSLGSLVGMYGFRHKTKHKKFTTGIPCIIVLQLISILYLIKIDII